MHETQTEEHQIHIEVETKSLQLTDTRSVQIKSTLICESRRYSTGEIEAQFCCARLSNGC